MHDKELTLYLYLVNNYFRWGNVVKNEITEKYRSLLEILSVTAKFSLILNIYSLRMTYKIHTHNKKSYTGV